MASEETPVAGKGLPIQLNHLIRGLAVIGAFVAAGIALRALENGQFFSTEWIDTYVRNRGLLGEAVFLAAGIVFTGFGLPRQVVCFLGGYAYGFVLGTALALAATVAGCGVAYVFARLVARDLVVRRLGGRIAKADAVLGQRPFSLILMIRLLPVGSNLGTNLVAGVSSAGIWPFLAASAVGHLPQTVVFALVGSGIHVDPAFRIGLAVVLFIVSMLLGTHLYVRMRRDTTLRAAIEAAGGGNGNGDADADERTADAGTESKAAPAQEL